jgi:hypothetical protein
MRFVLGIVVGAYLGFAVFYLPAAYVACHWMWPGSNLCGMPALMFVAPVGVVIGAVVGVRLARPKNEG